MVTVKQYTVIRVIIVLLVLVVLVVGSWVGCAHVLMPSALQQAATQAESFQVNYGDAVLKAMGGENHEGSVLHYAQTSSGQKTSIIFVHGSPGSHQAFAAYLTHPELQARFNLYAIDRPGFGGTQPGVPERSLTRQVKVLAPLLQSIEEKTILVGHSYGGPYILQAALMYPAEIDGLVLVAGSVDPDLEDMKWFNYLADTKLAKAIIPRDFFVSNQEILALADELRKMQRGLHKINVPVTVIQGERDKLVPVGNANYLKKQLTQTRPVVQIIEGQGHFILWSHPAFIIRALIEMEQQL